jgi:formamidase
MATYEVNEHPIFLPGNTPPQYAEWLAFSGTSVTLDGEQRYLDSQLAYQRACLHAINYLTTFGYSAEQAYLLLGAAPIEGRFSGVVDIPNSCATVYIPTAIFDFPVTPVAGQPTKIDPGVGAPHAAA